MKNYKIHLLVISSLWMGMTMSVDFVAVPLVFQTLTSLQEAGKLGIAVFSKFNSIEIFLSMVLFIASILEFLKNKNGRWPMTWVLFSILLTSLAVLYAFYLSPRIAFLGNEMHQFPLESEPYLVVYKEHQFFHKLYVKLDSLKLLLLLTMIVSCWRKISKEGESK
ncbi:MAG: hypothetical protein Fur0010_14570 [Bdellovibrio sp.]